MNGVQKEALRQQMLLRALWRDARPGVVGGWMRDGDRFARGLQAYQANAGALAERALGAAFPTIRQLVGDESFGALARALWRTSPPLRGDIAEWGDALPGFIEGDEQLADEPYLADVARVDWAVHQAERAADAAGAPTGLEGLAGGDAAALRLVLRPGTALVVSTHPVATIWQAHRSDDAERFAPVREAFAAGRAEAALVWRDGWRATVQAVDNVTARFIAALLARQTLAEALADAGTDFDFERWLLDALRRDAVHAVTREPS